MCAMCVDSMEKGSEVGIRILKLSAIEASEKENKDQQKSRRER